MVVGTWASDNTAAWVWESGAWGLQATTGVGTLTSVACTTITQCMTVGYNGPFGTNGGFGFLFQPVAEYWNNGSWSSLPVPMPSADAYSSSTASHAQLPVNA